MFSPRSLTALAALILFAAPGPLSAQGASAALNEAKSRAACGAGVPVSAQYLPGGLLKVTCRASNSQAVSETLPEAMQGTGLSPTAAFSHKIDNLSLSTLSYGPDGWRSGALNQTP